MAMRTLSLKLLGLCAALVLSQAAPAQGNSGKNRRNDCGNGNGNCAEQRGNSDQRGRDRQAPREQYRNDRNDFSQSNRDERGAGPNHDFHRGGRLPPEYRNRQYVVDDWRAHRLQAPPRGYHWVQTGGDYVLVAIATGVILQLILGGYN
jgi:Ni/Co efflux regulator RcnB